VLCVLTACHVAKFLAWSIRETVEDIKRLFKNL